MKKREFGINILLIMLAAAGIGLNAASALKKKESVYENDPKEKSPYYRKKVVFIPDENCPDNADGEKGRLEIVGDSEYSQGFYGTYVKRLLDIILSFGGLVLLAPVYLCISLAIIIDDPGPVLFTQKRMGMHKQYFQLHKFRSMKMCTPHDVPTHMLENPDQYITRVGKFLRAHSLDELPQIWDIFLGNMSVVGPRPGLWNQDVLTAERDKYNVNDVKPGLTGWAQINGRDEITIPEKARLDGEYVGHLSFAFDLKCFLGTLTKVAKDDSVVEGGTGRLAREKEGAYALPNVDEDGEVKKILITGCNSYIGNSVEAYLKHWPKRYEIEKIHMGEENWKEKDFSIYDTVFHVAGIAHADTGTISEEAKENYRRVNTDLTIEVAKKAKKDGVKQFIFMSSAIVYGAASSIGEEKIITKDAVPNPENAYGMSKLMAEQGILPLQDDGFDVVILRAPMVYGRECRGNYPVLSKFARKLPVFPNVKNSRSMIYVENLSEFVRLMIENKESGIFHPQNREYSNTSKLVEMIADAHEKKIVLLPGASGMLKLLSLQTELVNKAFGSLCYDMSLSEYKENYRVCGLKESIKRTERS